MSRIHTLLTGLLSVLLFALPAPSGAAEPPTRWFDAPSEVFRGEPHETLFLRTPTSALGFFVDAAAQGQTDLAALTLDRRVIDATPRPWSDDELVEHLDRDHRDRDYIQHNQLGNPVRLLHLLNLTLSPAMEIFFLLGIVQTTFSTWTCLDLDRYPPSNLWNQSKSQIICWRAIHPTICDIWIR